MFNGFRRYTRESEVILIFSPSSSLLQTCLSAMEWTLHHIYDIFQDSTSPTSEGSTHKKCSNQLCQHYILLLWGVFSFCCLWAGLVQSTMLMLVTQARWLTTRHRHFPHVRNTSERAHLPPILKSSIKDCCHITLSAKHFSLLHPWKGPCSSHSFCACWLRRGTIWHSMILNSRKIPWVSVSTVSPTVTGHLQKQVIEMMLGFLIKAFLTVQLKNSCDVEWAAEYIIWIPECFSHCSTQWLLWYLFLFDSKPPLSLLISAPIYYAQVANNTLNPPT